MVEKISLEKSSYINKTLVTKMWIILNKINLSKKYQEFHKDLLN